MTIRLRLDSEQIESIGRVLTLDSAQLAAIRDHWDGLKSSPLHPADLIAATRGCSDPKTGEALDKVVCEELVGQLLSFYTVLRRSGSELDDIREALARAFSFQLTPDQNETWQTIETEFFVLLASKVVRLTALALELSYDYANLLKRTNVIADIRPIYDDTAETIDATVISFTLRLEYSSSIGVSDLSIAMDEEDLVQLRKQCDRALKKSKTAEKNLESGLIAPTLVSGKRGK